METQKDLLEARDEVKGAKGGEEGQKVGDEASDLVAMLPHIQQKIEESVPNQQPPVESQISPQAPEFPILNSMTDLNTDPDQELLPNVVAAELSYRASEVTESLNPAAAASPEAEPADEDAGQEPEAELRFYESQGQARKPDEEPRDPTEAEEAAHEL